MEVADYLLEQGATLNIRDEIRDETALHEAARNWRVAMVTMLIDKWKADVNVLNSSAETPLGLTRNTVALWKEESRKKTQKALEERGGKLGVDLDLETWENWLHARRLRIRINRLRVRHAEKILEDSNSKFRKKYRFSLEENALIE